MYVDDGILATAGLDKAQANVCVVRESLESARFLVNADKSHWELQHEAQWLGYLRLGYISVPPQKIESLQSVLVIHQ